MEIGKIEQLTNTQMWEGSLGDSYTDRNKVIEIADEREWFWKRIIGDYGVGTALEVGCNRGFNLSSFVNSGVETYGIDVNGKALEEAKRWLPDAEVLYGKAQYIPFRDNYFDFVFTCGVLIHINPADYEKVIKELYRVSNGHILVAEYWAKHTSPRKFLGQLDVTWESPFDKVIRNTVDVEPVEEGKLPKSQGFNDLKYFVFKVK